MIPDFSYNVLQYNVDAAFTRKEFQYDGSLLSYHYPPNGPELSVQMENQDNDAIIIRPKSFIKMPFTRGYITLANANIVAGVSLVQLIATKPDNIVIQSNDVLVDTISSILNITSVERTANVTHAQITVGASETLLSASNSSRKTTRIYNLDNQIVFLGESGVTVNNGYPLLPGYEFPVDRYTGAVYGICNSGQSAKVAVWQEGV